MRVQLVCWATLLGACALPSDWILSGVVVDGWWPYIVGGAVIATGVQLDRFTAQAAANVSNY